MHLREVSTCQHESAHKRVAHGCSQNYGPWWFLLQRLIIRVPRRYQNEMRHNGAIWDPNFGNCRNHSFRPERNAAAKRSEASARLQPRSTKRSGPESSQINVISLAKSRTRQERFAAASRSEVSAHVHRNDLDLSPGMSGQIWADQRTHQNF